MEFEFKNNETVQSLDDLPDHIKPFYDGEDNSFSIREEFAPAAAAFDALNKALAGARKAERNIKNEKLGPWLALGESPDVVRAQIEELEARVKDSSKGGVNLDKMKVEFENAKKSILEEAEADLAKMRAALQHHMVEAQAAQAIAAARGDVELLMPHVLRQAALVNDGDDWQVRVVDQSGDPRGDGKGGFMGVTDLVNEMKNSKSLGRGFDSDDRAGAGTGTDGRDAGRASNGVRPGTAMSATQKIAAGLAERR
jgi:hypothetical protein